MLGGFIAYNIYSTSKEFNAGLSVSMKQKATAFEINQTVLHLSSLSKTRTLTNEELTKFSGLISNWELVQRALVDGNEVYRISQEKSSELRSKLDATSDPLLNSLKNLKALSQQNSNWNDEQVSNTIKSVEAFAVGMNDVSGQYNKESDEQLSTSLYMLFALGLGTFVLLWLASRLLLIPLLRRAEESETIKTMVAKEIEDIRNSKVEFLGNMSHELRTPLNGLIGMTEILYKTKLTEEQDKYVRSIRNSANNLLNIVSDILDHSSLESGDIEIRKENFSIAECVEQVIDLLKPSIGEKKIELIYDIDVTLPDSLIQDERRIRQTLVNILGYAIQHTEAGDIFLKVELLNQEAEFIQAKFSVHSSGLGMTEDQKRRAFHSFDGSTNGSESLGLAITKKLIDRLGGRIWVDGNNIQGTTVAFTIVAESGSSIDLSKVSKLAGKKVLVIDDNKTNLKVLVKQLSVWGMQATPFNSSDLVVDMIDNLTKFDLCILDSSMASVGGIPLVERIRMRYSEDELPIILTSATGQTFQQNKDGLYTAFLTKPIKQSKLLETVLQIVQGDSVPKSGFGSHEGDFGKKHLKILIAYDNDLTRAVTEKNLTIYGHTCTSVKSGRDMVDKASTGQFDLVIVDSQLSELSGIEALRHLKKITNEDDMPLVFGLAEEQAQGRRLMKQAGADEILPAKHAAEDIQKKIEEWFEK